MYKKNSLNVLNNLFFYLSTTIIRWFNLSKAIEHEDKTKQIYKPTTCSLDELINDTSDFI